MTESSTDINDWLRRRGQPEPVPDQPEGDPDAGDVPAAAGVAAAGGVPARHGNAGGGEGGAGIPARRRSMDDWLRDAYQAGPGAT